MNTKSGLAVPLPFPVRVGAAGAAVTGARHLRVGRNGQDAAAAWFGGDCGAIVVCDGCSAGACSELGARLGSQLVIARLAARLNAGARIGDAEVWATLREGVTAELARIVDGMPGDASEVIEEHFLFTIVAAAWDGEQVAVWALGDGAYAFGDQIRTLGPFDNNQPPYVGYDLFGIHNEPHFVVADAACGSVFVATDGIAEIGFDAFVDERDVDHFLAHPDALRRQLVVRTRPTERVDWDARRIERRPAPLQDDGAIAVMRWSV